MKRRYRMPQMESQQSFDTSALGCGKTTDPPPGSFHWGSAYDTFSGHFGPGFGGSESVSGSAGVGFGPGATSQSYNYYGMCMNFILYSS